jgi:hypothetical protein
MSPLQNDAAAKCQLPEVDTHFKIRRIISYGIEPIEFFITTCGISSSPA